MKRKKINGISIDCSRLLERKTYYHTLLEFAAEWGINTVILHFTDDHGCSVVLPGYQHLARPHSFAPDEIMALSNHASTLGIDLIPEVETFGHTRYLTDRPEYRHLSTVARDSDVDFNAIDPTSEESFELILDILKATTMVFSSRYLHLGCDEVSLTGFLEKHPELNEADVWADYVNRIIGATSAMGKSPMIWADHLAKNAEDEDVLKVRKDALVMDWQYEPTADSSSVLRLKELGYKRITTSPSIACYLYRFLPTISGLTNTQRLAAVAAEQRLAGCVTTIWCPYRYIQGALYYGIAYSATVVSGGGEIDMDAFNAKFVQRVFGTPISDPIAEFLSIWPKLEIDNKTSLYLVTGESEDSLDEIVSKAKTVNALAKQALDLASQYSPEKNDDIWDAMVLAAKCAWLCSGKIALTDQERKAAGFEAEVKATMEEMSQVWDDTRYPDDPQKHRAQFANEESEHAMLLLKHLLKE